MTILFYLKLFLASPLPFQPIQSTSFVLNLRHSSHRAETELSNNILIEIHFSKLDEVSQEDQLGFVLPQHEFFHQYFVAADAQKELIGDRSRGLDGGSFLLATLLNRKEVRSKKGKEAIEAFKEFYLLKSDAMFCGYLLEKYQLDESVDNTPASIRSASKETKLRYIHDLVCNALKDLLPYFQETEININPIPNFPLNEGLATDSISEGKNLQEINAEIMSGPIVITQQQAQATASMIVSVNKDQYLRGFMTTSDSFMSMSRKKPQFECSLCSTSYDYQSICLSHIECCLKKLNINENHSGKCQIQAKKGPNYTKIRFLNQKLKS